MTDDKDIYLSAFNDFQLRRFQIDCHKILKLTEDFLDNIDKTSERTLLIYPNHNIVRAMKLREALTSTLSVIDEELQVRKEHE